MSLSKTKILITGCSRGLGLGLTQSFLDSGATVIATCRDPSTATQLNELKKTFSDQLFIFPLDVKEEKSHQDLSDSLLSSGIDSIDVVIANAGISTSDHSNESPLNSSTKNMMEVYQTNVIGTMLTFQTLSNFVFRGKGKLLVSMSSTLGSIKLATTGYSSYRASKAALNMFSKVFAHDPTVVSHGVKVICMHPGWVQTDMGGSNAPLVISQSASGMKDVIHQALDIQMNPTGSNRMNSDFSEAFSNNRCVYTAYNGELLPW